MTTNGTIPLFLFDVDGVLINPLGYKEALSAAVEYFAERLGQPKAKLTYEEIALFEACGLTNEWDSLAMCVSLMLAGALAEHEDLLRNTFDLTAETVRRAGYGGKRPDFGALAREVRTRNPEGMRPSHTVRDILMERTEKHIHPLLHELLDNVYTIGAPTTRIFQHYTLGSERFKETYGTNPEIKVASQLLIHDVPHIQSGVLEEFLSREYEVSIYTARPSLPPADLTEEAREKLNTAEYPPEGDLAAGLLGVIDKVPIIGAGRVMWLASKNGASVADYMKPSPVQAMAAIAAAISFEEATALEAAITFLEGGKLTPPLDKLQGRSTHVIVFEDSVGGITAVKRAVEALSEAGIDITVEAVGVAREQTKKDVLAAVADRVIEDINLGLSPYLT